MSRGSAATGLWAAAALTLLALGGCTGRGPEASAPPPTASTPPPASAPELMGGPREQAAPAPQTAPEPPGITMAPIANPEDMSPDERARVYGQRYDQPGRLEHHHARRLHRLIGAGAGAHGRTAHHHLGDRLTARPAQPATHTLAAPPHARPKTGAAETHHQKAAPTPSPGAQPAAAPTTAPAPRAAEAPTAPLASPNLEWLSIPGAPFLDLPGFGRVPSKFVTAAGLLLLALILLALAAGAGQRAPVRRRPTRQTVGAGPTFADERSPAPTPHEPSDAPLAPFPHHDDTAPR